MASEQNNNLVKESVLSKELKGKKKIMKIILILKKKKKLK